MQTHLACEGNQHEQLLVSAGDELRLKLQALRPCLLADCASTIAVVFVQGAKCAEVDLGVKDVLQSGRDVVAVIVIMVSMVMAVRFVVAM